MITLAKSFGWTDAFLEKKSPKRGRRPRLEQAAVDSSHDVQSLLAQISSHVQSQVANQQSQVTNQQSQVTNQQSQVTNQQSQMQHQEIQNAQNHQSVVQSSAGGASDVVVAASSHEVPMTPMHSIRRPPADGTPALRDSRHDLPDDGDSSMRSLEMIARTAQSKAMARPSHMDDGSEIGQGVLDDVASVAPPPHDESRDDDDSHGAANPKCAICWEEMGNGCMLLVEALPCAHAFHEECLDGWRATCNITNMVGFLLCSSHMAVIRHMDLEMLEQLVIMRKTPDEIEMEIRALR